MTNNEIITVLTYCPFCGEEFSVQVNSADYDAWKDGVPAQVAFPYLSADERELLISGICPACWAEMFGV